MKNWNEVQPIVLDVLKEYRYKKGDYDEPCFLTAYQLAVLADRKDSTLKDGLPIGGEGEGGDDNSSFAQRIAWNLSKDIKDGALSEIEIRFFCTAGLGEKGKDGRDGFVFDDKHIPSAGKFSMFRLKQ